MIPYFFMLFLPLTYDTNLFGKNKYFLKFFIFFSLFLFVGLRHNIGGDWHLYLEAGRLGSVYKSLDDTIIALFYLFSYELFHIGIYGVNLLTASLLFYSIYKFLSLTQYFGLGLFILFPVVVVIGAMGFTTQTIAFSFGLLSIFYLSKKNIFIYFIYVILASLSHISGIFYLIFILSIFKNLSKLILASIFFFLVALIYYLANYAELNRTFYFYLGEGLSFISAGALPRLLITVFSAFLFLFFVRKNISNFIEKNIFTIMALLSIISFPLAAFYSTFVDRVALYFIPLQAYSILKTLSIVQNLNTKKIIYLSVILVYFLVLTIWLIFGNFSKHWLPYKIFPLEYCAHQRFNQEFCYYFNYRPNIDYSQDSFDLDLRHE